MTKHILIVDDHPFLRMGVKTYIEENFASTVCAETDNAAETLVMLKKTRFDFAFIDISLGDENGLNLAGIVKKKQPECRVIILSMHKEPLLVQKAKNLNLDGYLIKEDAFSAFSNIFKDNNSSGFIISKKLESSVFETEESDKTILSMYNTLTRREQTIFRLLAEGLSSKEIAYDLGIRHKTVLVHRHNLMQKMDMKNQTDILKCAIKLGLINYS